MMKSSSLAIEQFHWCNACQWCFREDVFFADYCKQHIVFRFFKRMIGVIKKSAGAYRADYAGVLEKSPQLVILVHVGYQQLAS